MSSLWSFTVLHCVTLCYTVLHSFTSYTIIAKYINTCLEWTPCNKQTQVSLKQVPVETKSGSGP